MYPEPVEYHLNEISDPINTYLGCFKSKFKLSVTDEIDFFEVDYRIVALSFVCEEIDGQQVCQSISLMVSEL